jgi:MFS transporter, ACS family, D-galactonate transporter
VGALGSIMNCCGQLMSLVALVVTGFLFDATGSFASSFVLSAILIGIGVPCFLLLMGPIQQLPSREEARRADAVPV